MLSPALEVVLSIALREAVSRRHTHLTLEHLLYALAHDPDGERILAACCVDLPALRRALDTYLDESIERWRRGTERDSEQTLRFAGSCRRRFCISRAHSGTKRTPATFSRRFCSSREPRRAASDKPGRDAPGHPQLHFARHHEDTACDCRRSRHCRWHDGRRGCSGPRARRCAPGVLCEPDGSGAAGAARSSSDEPGSSSAPLKSCAAGEEQPRVRRRSWRRQDGDGRGPRRTPSP